MKPFGNYSEYYNLLYGDKDYQSEAAFVDALIQKYAPGAKDLLDLGCGTGRHAFCLVDRYSVLAVDMSEQMLALARSSLGFSNYSGTSIQFIQGDIRTFRISRKFDAIISLFHVMSYQTTDDDLVAALKTAKTHLRGGGVFIFDCWYGPAVMTERPAVRTKRLEDENIEVTRLAEPVIYPNENVVDVNYTVWVKDKRSSKIEEIKETHRMRYLFMPEIVSMLRRCGFELVDTGEWMTGKPPGFESWSVYFVGRM
jgi:SAM-dependent methyltransferase